MSCTSKESCVPLWRIKSPWEPRGSCAGTVVGAECRGSQAAAVAKTNTTPLLHRACSVGQVACGDHFIVIRGNGARGLRPNASCVCRMPPVSEGRTSMSRSSLPTRAGVGGRSGVESHCMNTRTRGPMWCCCTQAVHFFAGFQTPFRDIQPGHPGIVRMYSSERSARLRSPTTSIRRANARSTGDALTHRNISRRLGARRLLWRLWPWLHLESRFHSRLLPRRLLTLLASINENAGDTNDIFSEWYASSR